MLDELRNAFQIALNSDQSIPLSILLACERSQMEHNSESLRLLLDFAGRGIRPRARQTWDHSSAASRPAGLNREPGGAKVRLEVLVWHRPNRRARPSQPAVGRGWHGDPEGHASAGRKGGAKVSLDRSPHGRNKAAAAAPRVSQDRTHMAEIGRRGGEKVSQDRSHMANIGKKGGESR